MYKNDLALNDQQELIFQKPNQTKKEIFANVLAMITWVFEIQV